MDLNFESESPDNADKEPTFRKPSNDKANRKYRRHSSRSGSMSSSSDGSPKRGRSPSPPISREDPTRTSRKNGEKELDMEPGRSRYDKGSDSHRHSDRTYRSSRDYHKHDDYERHHKRADEGERSYHRSSGSHRDSRSGSRSDRTKQGNEHDKWADYRRSSDRYAKERSDDKEHRRKDKDREDRKEYRDKSSTMERITTDRRHTSSSMDDSTRHGHHSSKESDWGQTKGSREKGDPMEKRKHEGRETDRHKEKFSREPDEKDSKSPINGKDYGEDDLRKDFPTRVNVENESSTKKFKLFTAEKDLSNSNQGQVSTVTPAQSSNQTEASHDLDAAKVAAMKAAELVNKNLVGSGYMSTDQKKKLLWGSKKATPVEESGRRWNVPLFSDSDRQEKFKKLMGVKGDLKAEQKVENNNQAAEKQEQLQLDLEKQYTAGLRRRDGRTVGLGL